MAKKTKMEDQTQTGGERNSEDLSRPARKVAIRQIPSGVRGLDEILGGGIPELSFNIIAGTPGCGKTTLAHQILFANATVESPALYFTVLGEPALKMMRYQQQYEFFDEAKIGTAIRFINLEHELRNGSLEAVLEEITRHVTTSSPSLVVVDSFRSVVRKSRTGASDIELQGFVQALAQFLTSWQATSFLVGEYAEDEIHDNPVFTIADGLIWLSQVAERNSVVRKLQVVKLRGQESVPGLHTVRISAQGMQAFSRTLGLTGRKTKPQGRQRLSLGIPQLDLMLGGGVLQGDSLLIAGPSGSGKSAIATQFISEGLRNGENAIIAVFEERPEGYAARAGELGMDLKTPQEQGKLKILYLRPLDLSVDESMREILDVVKEIGATRLVIDSLAGFEMALAPGFRTDYRESLYRMIGALTGAGVTILSTVEVEDTFTTLPFSHYAVSFLTDDIVRLRYVEMGGYLRMIMVVIKMRGSSHSREIREYKITSAGIVVTEPHETGYSEMTTGLPKRICQLPHTVPSPVSGNNSRGNSSESGSKPTSLLAKWLSHLRIERQ